MKLLLIDWLVLRNYTLMTEELQVENIEHFKLSNCIIKCLKVKKIYVLIHSMHKICYFNLSKKKVRSN